MISSILGKIEELNCVLTSGSVTQVGYLTNEKNIDDYK